MEFRRQRLEYNIEDVGTCEKRVFRKHCTLPAVPRTFREIVYVGYEKVNVLLQLPLTVVQRTNVTRLEPSRDAVEVERVLDHPKSADHRRRTE